MSYSGEGMGEKCSIDAQEEKTVMAGSDFRSALGPVDFPCLDQTMLLDDNCIWSNRRWKYVGW